MAEQPEAGTGVRSRTRVLVGYEPSPGTVAAVCGAALLMPRASAWVAHVWTPLADPATLRRLAVDAGSAAVLAHRIDAQGVARATRIAGSGAALASALGWPSEVVARRGVADPGAELARLAAELEPDVVVVGSRGLRGGQALWGSVSDLVVHRSDRPVLVVASPMSADLFTTAATGPVVVGWDGSEGAGCALGAVQRLFPGRRIFAVTAGPSDVPPPPLPPPRDQPSPAPGTGRPDELLAVPVHTPSLAHGRAVAQALADFAADRHAAVIVVGSRGRPGLSEVLLGSVAMATLHHGRLPVLVVPPERAASAG